MQELAEEYGEDFLQSKREAIPWKETTYKDDESIFNKKAKPLLLGLNPSEMTVDDYHQLQVNICMNASASAKSDKYKNWKPGEELPSMGKREYICYIFSFDIC